MRHLFVVVSLLCVLAAQVAGVEMVIPLDGDVPPGDETHFFLPFEVPDGIAEIEVRHSDQSDANILDWGLDDPDGFRGWGGGNSEPAIVGVDAASRSYVPGRIKPGTWEVVVGKAKIVEQPARYAIEVILRDTPTLAPQSERRPYAAPTPLARGARWYAGDFHVHSRESGDAQPAIDAVLQFAASRNLDFIMLSEHNTNSQLSLYAAAQEKSPNVLLLPGVEFTTYGGHANGIGARQWVDHRIGVRGATIADAIRQFHAQGALFSINHPRLRLGDLCIGCGWDHPVDPQMIDAVEVRTGIVSGVSYWESVSAQGAHATAVGGSDDHRGGVPGSTIDSPIGSPTTMVYASELSVDAIVEGVRNGRTVVKLENPDGPMIDTEISGKRRGKIVYAERSHLRATVTGGSAMTLRLVKNGTPLEEVAIDADPFVHEYDIEAPPSGEDRYRYEVRRGSTPVTIASYVWLQRPSPDANPLLENEGCSMTNTASRPTALLVMLAMLATQRAHCRRRKHR